MRVLLDECLPNLDALLKKTTDEASRPAQSARRAGNSLWSRLSIQKQFSTRKVERIGKAMQTFDRARRRGNFAEMQESVQRAIERKPQAMARFFLLIYGRASTRCTRNGETDRRGAGTRTPFTSRDFVRGGGRATCALYGLKRFCPSDRTAVSGDLGVLAAVLSEL